MTRPVSVVISASEMPLATMPMVWSPPPPVDSAPKVESMPVTVPSSPTSGAVLTQMRMTLRSRSRGAVSDTRSSWKKVAVSSSVSPPVTNSSMSPMGPRRSSG